MDEINEPDNDEDGMAGPAGPRERGVERAIQRVLAGMATFYLLTAAGWSVSNASNISAVEACLLVAGCLTQIVIIVRGWTGRLNHVDVAASLVALAVVSAVDPDLDPSLVGTDGGPAYVFWTTAMLSAALVLPWRQFFRVALVVAAIYLAGRAWHGGTTGFTTAIDEVATDASTIAAAGLFLAFYRRAGRRADLTHETRSGATSRVRKSREQAEDLERARRLLHDDIIASLVTIEVGGGAAHPDRARTAARRALDALSDVHIPEVTDIGRGHDGAALDVEVDIPVEVAEMPIPDHVRAALTGATAEALRNVERHSGTDRAIVRAVRVGDGIAMTIRDSGRGFELSGASGFGIRHSIVGRLNDVGGRAVIASVPGGGTDVRLEWSPHPSPDLPVTPSLDTTIGDGRRFVIAVTTTATVGQAWLVARHGIADASWPLSIVLAATSIVLCYVAGLLGVRRHGRHALVVGVGIAQVGILLGGLALAGDGALRGFAAWSVAVTCAYFFAVAFVIDTRVLIGLGLLFATTITAWAVHDPSLSPGDVSDPILQPIFYAVAVGASAAGMRSVLRDTRTDELGLDVASREDAAERHRSALDVAGLTFLRQASTAFLRQVAAGDVDLITAQTTRLRAHELATQARDELYLPGLLDDESRHTIAALRRRGCSLTIREGADTSHTPDLARLLAMIPLAARSAVMSFQPGESRLVVVPPISGADIDDASNADIEADEFSTTVTIRHELGVSVDHATGHTPPRSVDLPVTSPTEGSA